MPNQGLTSHVSRLTSHVSRLTSHILRLTSHVLLLTFLSGCFVNINLLPTVEPLQEIKVGGEGKDKIALVHLSGVISNQKDDGFMASAPNLVAQIKEELQWAQADPDVKAVVIRINSPGGTVTASDLIYHELKMFKEKTGKKVIASIMDLGASGGYYVAVAADKIIVHPTTVTGSIGVIMLSLNMKGLLEKIGVSGTAIKSGPLKDMGSPVRSMTKEERNLFQGIIDEMYERFLSVIETGRKNLSPEQIRKAADGRVYTARQAMDLGLVDQIGYLDDAFALARKEAGIHQATVVRYIRPGNYENNIYSQVPRGGPLTVNLFNLDLQSMVQSGAPSFMYLWAP